MIETVLKEPLYKFTTFKNANIIEMWSGYLFIFIFEDLFIYLFIYSDYQEKWLEDPIVHSRCSKIHWDVFLRYI